MKFFNVKELNSNSNEILSNLFRVLVFVLSMLMVVFISFDTFQGQTFYRQPLYLKVQLWVCLIFLAVFFIEFYISKNKKQYWKTNFFFFFVSIPYQYIIVFLNLHLPSQIMYLLGFVPLIRGGYALAVIVKWLTNNKISSLVWTYLIILLSIVYFSSLTFYLFEKNVNPLVTNYKDALWWAAMDVTTVGSNIIAVTSIGRVMSVMLAALGMMMFPIFTVYVGSIFRTHNAKEADVAVKQATIKNPSDIDNSN